MDGIVTQRHETVSFNYDHSTEQGTFDVSVFAHIVLRIAYPKYFSQLISALHYFPIIHKIPFQ